MAQNHPKKGIYTVKTYKEGQEVKPGTLFTATDKLGRKFTYRFNDVDPLDSAREFKLYNMTTNSETEVEAEWFRQRKIQVIKEAE